MNMINTQSIEEAKKMLKNEQYPKIILAQNDDFNRKIVEQAKFNILLSVEKGSRKNKIRQTDSGLNHIVAKLCANNKIAIGINLEEIKSLEPKIKADRLAKVKQNIKICRKLKVQIAVKARNINKARDILQSLGS